MVQPDMDKAPDMIDVIVGEEGDQLVLSIPRDSIENLDPSKKEDTIKALSRFIIALRGDNVDHVEEDLAVVLGIDGVQLTLPGSEQPISVRVMFGGLMITGAASDLAQFDTDKGQA